MQDFARPFQTKTTPFYCFIDAPPPFPPPPRPGSLPNVYVYACNNPSESIVAKRRGYGTIVSHNVPPYGRAGLYKQLAELRALLQGARTGGRAAQGGRGGGCAPGRAG